jgi:hypothetical protein
MATATALILARWRAVVRQLEQTPQGLPERAALEDEAARLRDEYNRLEAIVVDPPPAPVAEPPVRDPTPG